MAKVIMGIYRPSGGSVYLDGRDITQLSVTERARLGIAYAFQNPPRFRGLTVHDLLKTVSGQRDDVPAVKAALRAVGLCPADYLDKEADARLSGGEMKRIELATVFIRKPRYAVLDELEAGVDLWGYDRLVRLLRDGGRRDGCMIVITHQEKIMAQADEILVMAALWSRAPNVDNRALAQFDELQGFDSRVASEVDAVSAAAIRGLLLRPHRKRSISHSCCFSRDQGCQRDQNRQTGDPKPPLPIHNQHLPKYSLRPKDAVFAPPIRKNRSTMQTIG